MTTEQYRKRSGFSIFLSFFKPHRGLFFLDMACALVVSMIDLAYPIISRYAMRTLLPQSAYRTFFTIMLIVLAAFTLGMVVGVLGMLPGWWSRRQAPPTTPESVPPPPLSSPPHGV